MFSGFVELYKLHRNYRNRLQIVYLRIYKEKTRYNLLIFSRDVIDKSICQSLYLEKILINFVKTSTQFVTGFCSFYVICRALQKLYKSTHFDKID